ncbi:uncharacterized protein Polr2M [Tribolium castaneum]|uniref:Uncharacterized protein n=1 Tax=Tribolium castaneum TaxID=7070 RepID=D6W7D7_TRICA|nr:PREDICTED: uncharacterized protein LOC103314976 [Tribolium castaneum]EFA11130.1 hypothetical protein TcasGA2_TC004731 [Tribolium castaneum]|eukprot:XP_008200613.1 PREDICTED: uncharacterized protein LOC103314976 [Tribolium castaneum]
MDTVKHKENLTKLSLEELEEIYEREQNILKNKKLVSKLPDKGKQLEQKLEEIKKEIDLKRSLRDIEGSLKTLTIDSSKAPVLNEKHVQHLCSMEKSPEKERYKPFSTLAHEDKSKNQKPTQLIPLAESITLLVEQANTLPVPDAKVIIEGAESEEEEDALDNTPL